MGEAAVTQIILVKLCFVPTVSRSNLKFLSLSHRGCYHSGFGFDWFRGDRHTSERNEESTPTVLGNMDGGGCDLSNLLGLQLEVADVIYWQNVEEHR